MSKIKRIFGVLLIALAAVVVAQGLSSCSSKDNRFDKAIEQLNKMLPMNLGNGFTMEKVTSDSEGIVYDIKCNDNEIDMDMMEQNKDELRAGTLAQLKSEKRRSKDFKSLLEYCQENGKKVIYRYKGYPSGKTVDIVISPDEI